MSSVLKNVETSTEGRALHLLGQGLPATVVASHLGVSDSRISQLLSDPNFAAKVQEARFLSLQSLTETDTKYNSIEKTLLNKLESLVGTLYRPREILSAISVINNAKRRGASPGGETGPTNHATVVHLTLPIAIQHKFITNINSQVIGIEDAEGNVQTLVTATASGVAAICAQRTALLKAQEDNLRIAQEDDSDDPITITAANRYIATRENRGALMPSSEEVAQTGYARSPTIEGQSVSPNECPARSSASPNISTLARYLMG